jgi:RNA polymerase sigma factor (sigma-70 family)
MSREQLFLSQLAVIERVIAWVCARRGLRGADAEDFGSFVKHRLIEEDYEVLAKFEGRSSLKTYLAAVINRLYLDFQVQRFGKWRPSAQARHLGPVALRLERLMFRDGLSFDEACSALKNDPAVTETRDALYAISQTLPGRVARGPREEAKAPLTGAAAVERAERQALADRTFSVIGLTLRQLPAQDRIFLRLHLESGFTVAEASRSLGLEQKTLYRTKESVLKRLRADLEARGIGSEAAHELLATLDWDAALGFQDPESVTEGEESGSRPSHERDRPTPGEGGRDR